jgi:hypothetical protein
MPRSIKRKELIMMRKLAAATLAVAVFSSQALAADAMLGQREPADYGDRTIVLTSGTTAVNVRHGEIIHFVVGDKSFSWGFTEPATISVVDLNAVAPAGMLDHQVKAYIKRMPTEDGG